MDAVDGLRVLWFESGTPPTWHGIFSGWDLTRGSSLLEAELGRQKIHPASDSLFASWFVLMPQPPWTETL